MASAALTCLALVACGGDDPEPADESTTTTEAVEESTTTTESDETTTTTEGEEASGGSGGSEELCSAYQEVADTNGEFQSEFQAILGPFFFSEEEPTGAEAEAALEQVRTLVAEGTPPLLAAYDELAGVIDDELVDEVEAVQAYTEHISGAIGDAPDIETVVAEIFAATEDPVALASAEANEALAADADEACGIELITG